MGIISTLNVNWSDTKATFRAMKRGAGGTISSLMSSVSSFNEEPAQTFSMGGKEVQLKQYNEMQLMGKSLPEAQEEERAAEPSVSVIQKVESSEELIQSFSTIAVEGDEIEMRELTTPLSPEQSAPPAVDDEVIRSIYASLFPQISLPVAPPAPIVEEPVKEETAQPESLDEEPVVLAKEESAALNEAPMALPKPEESNLEKISLPADFSVADQPLLPTDRREKTLATSLTTTLATKADLVRLQTNNLKAASIAALVAISLWGAFAYISLYPKEGMEPHEEMVVRSMSALCLLVSLVGTMYTVCTGKDL